MEATNDAGESVEEIEVQNELRSKHYNAELVSLRRVHEDLIRIEVRPDQPFQSFEAGQYVALGLGRWEPRVPGCQADVVDESKRHKMVHRAYSISCPMLRDGHLRRVDAGDTLEFYIVLVREASEPDGDPPLLTPRLFALSVGDRLKMQTKITGRYTLQNIGPNEAVWMFGTGTGEAPHNAMVAELLSRDHRGPIINVTTVRHGVDLGYTEEHDELMRRHDNYCYLPLTTRDSINVDPEAPGYIGRRYMQQAVTDGYLSEVTGFELSPANSHVFLCGNPAMIGYTPPGATPPTTPGMIQTLGELGFRSAEDVEVDGPGVIRFEKYW